MRSLRSLVMAGAAAFGVAGFLTGQDGFSVKIKSTDVGGVVMSSNGPESGVWVIAETTDLPTRYIKEVVTDDRGWYLIPDFPKARYTVLARGYGLVDSPKVETEPGKRVVYVGVAGHPSVVDTRSLVLKDVTAVGILGASAGLPSWRRTFFRLRSASAQPGRSCTARRKQTAASSNRSARTSVTPRWLCASTSSGRNATALCRAFAASSNRPSP